MSTHMQGNGHTSTIADWTSGWEGLPVLARRECDTTAHACPPFLTEIP